MVFQSGSLHFTVPGPLLHPRPWPWPPVPKLTLLVLVPIFVFTGLGPQFLFTGPSLQFLVLVQGLSLNISTLSPKFIFTVPGLQFMLPVRIYLIIGIGNSGSSNISSSSNFFGIDNSNISMSIIEKQGKQT